MYTERVKLGDEREDKYAKVLSEYTRTTETLNKNIETLISEIKEDINNRQMFTQKLVDNILALHKVS